MAKTVTVHVFTSEGTAPVDLEGKEVELVSHSEHDVYDLFKKDKMHELGSQFNIKKDDIVIISPCEAILSHLEVIVGKEHIFVMSNNHVECEHVRRKYKVEALSPKKVKESIYSLISS